MEVDCDICPVYCDISCALLAIDLASKTKGPIFNQCRRYHVTEFVYWSRLHLFGFLVVRAQARENELHGKLERMEMEVKELKKRRTEDAKANEKVAGIFAAHEQRWLAEKKSLQCQLQLLIKEMCALKTRHEDEKSDMKRRLEEEQCAIGFKDEALEQEIKKCRDAEEKLKHAEQVMSELREKAQKEEQDHASEIWKHKTAFVELMSNQRRLESELARTTRQADMANRELERATTTLDELSSEVLRLKKDVEQKDKVLTALLRKSKIDAADKQMLLKEVKVAMTRKKQAEVDAERWRKMWQCQRQSSRKGGFKGSSRYNHAGTEGCSNNNSTVIEANSGTDRRGVERKKQHLADYFEAENKSQRELDVRIEENNVMCVQFVDQFPGYVENKPGTVLF